MEKRKLNGSIPDPGPDVERIVAENYAQLLHWAKLLTNGDPGKAQDLVQELYLHFALAKPDLGDIEKLDGYLYISLKHLYLSMLARSSREAMHLVSVEDFDSVELALQMLRSVDLLQTQNELRRLCCYSVWRKEQSKSFCYFILHFFHGYYRHEISELARVPLAAIYNKLKSARDEGKSYLQNSGKLSIAGTDPAPEPVLVWSPVSAPELFRELRGLILAARISECLPEHELLAHYNDEAAGAIPRELLAHIVSCERCLSIIDKRLGRPLLEEREPLDAIGYFGENRNLESRKAKDRRLEKTIGGLQHRRQQYFEHRPRILSIAVNGCVIAFHEVFSERSTLTARTERFEEANFVEVFTEQGLRLAFLSILEPPPSGPHTQSQFVLLSDGRWLRLSLSFDGQGLSSEVIYFDPILRLVAEVEEDEDLAYQAKPASNASLSAREKPHFRDRLKSIVDRVGNLLGGFTPVAATAWSMLLLVGISTAGYLLYRQMEQPMSAGQVLHRSIQVAASELQGQTEHQVLRFEERSSEGNLLRQGSIDLWKDGDGVRSLRRFYNEHQHLIAAEWQLRDGEKKSYLKAESEQDRVLTEDDLWRTDVAPQAFVPMQHQSMQLRRTPEEYEVSLSGALAESPQVVSVTLVLNHQWHFVRQVMHVRRGAKIYEVRYEQVSEEKKPTNSVPDAFFGQEAPGLSSPSHNKTSKLSSSSTGENGRDRVLSDMELAQLQIGVLYEMSQLGSDSSDPLEVVRTPDGRLRVSGAVAEESRKQELLSRFNTLSDRQFLDVQMSSPHDGTTALRRLRRFSPQQLEVYDVGQRTPLADKLLRRSLASKQLSGEALNLAINSFSRDTLSHAQLALQEANALHRLGNAFSATELRGLPPESQQLWAEMVVKHATLLQSQINALSEELNQLAPKAANAPAIQMQAPDIADIPGFLQATESLLQQMQSIHHQVGQLFASSISADEADDAEVLIAHLRASMPRQRVEDLVRFALRLKQ